MGFFRKGTKGKKIRIERSEYEQMKADMNELNLRRKIDEEKAKYDKAQSEYTAELKRRDDELAKAKADKAKDPAPADPPKEPKKKDGEK